MKPRTISGTHRLSRGPFPGVQPGVTAAVLRLIGVRERPGEFVRQVKTDAFARGLIRYEFVLGDAPAPAPASDPSAGH